MRGGAPGPFSVTSAGCRMPALALAFDLSVGGQPGHYAIEIVRFDTHLLRDLGDRDPGRRAHKLKRLIGSRTTSAAATRPAGTTTRRSAPSGRRRPGRASGAWTTRSTPAAGQRGTRRLQPGHFFLELAQTVIDFLHGCVDEASQIDSPSVGFALKIQRVSRVYLLRSNSALSRASELLASRSDVAPTMNRLATLPRRPPGGMNSLV
jgi:hypothetical protein